MLTRWQPVSEIYGELARLQNEVNRLFGRQGRNGNEGRMGVPAGYPALNMWQDDDNLIVEAELPGMELEDIEIFVDDGNQLTIKGERKAPVQETGAWHRRERGFGKFRPHRRTAFDGQCRESRSRVEEWRTDDDASQTGRS